jgi:hypothetical protein
MNFWEELTLGEKLGICIVSCTMKWELYVCGRMIRGFSYSGQDVGRLRVV